MSRLNFKIEAEAPGSRARAGHFHGLHGEVQTPIFMPVGTQATVKTQSVDSLKASGSRVLLANTYHLMLRPGPEVFRHFGGIHKFMNWDGLVLTDSGGFQIFSISKLRQMTEAGAVFQSHIDGTTHMLSPERSIEVQRAIGSDIMMVLDQCVPSTVDHATAKTAMELTHRWAQRSLDARGDSPQSMFGIVQGACFRDLRRQSAETLAAMPFDGLAIGGLAVGETKAEREDFTEYTTTFMPKNLPRYLMGVGTPLDILEAVHRGVDMFDCIMPSQLAQRGTAFTSTEGRLQLRRTNYKFADEKLDPNCDCHVCQNYSRGYLHHLHKAAESLGWKLLTRHNITFYHRLMREIRASILNGTFVEYYRVKREQLAMTDNTHKSAPPKFVLNKTLGDYEVLQSAEGYCSVRQKSSGEVMHSVSNPIEEATSLYIDQSRLLERLSEVNEKPLVIWDVGLGAGANAMAAIQAREKLGPEARRLHVVSFENDLDSFRLAVKFRTDFPYLKHPSPNVLLEKGLWNSGCVTWELREGDFVEQFSTAPMPDLIFYDMFSAKTHAGPWSPAFFSKLFDYVRDHHSELFTYSTSTAIRASLLHAGFFTAVGTGTGPKAETTSATTRVTEHWREKLLGEKWLDRWSRSQAKFPNGLEDSARAAFAAKILSHPQFHS